jgi:hypothetical protein
MSPARDQFAKTTTRFCTRSLLIVVAETPARRSRRIGPDKPFLAAHPTIRQSGYLGKEHNDAASVASDQELCASQANPRFMSGHKWWCNPDRIEMATMASEFLNDLAS